LITTCFIVVGKITPGHAEDFRDRRWQHNIQPTVYHCAFALLEVLLVLLALLGLMMMMPVSSPLRLAWLLC